VARIRVAKHKSNSRGQFPLQNATRILESVVKLDTDPLVPVQKEYWYKYWYKLSARKPT